MESQQKHINSNSVMYGGREKNIERGEKIENLIQIVENLELNTFLKKKKQSRLKNICNECKIL